VQLPGDHAAERRLERGEAPQHLAHRGHLVGARGVRDLARQADDELQLGVEAHVRLVVAVAVPRRPDVDLAREDRVHVHEHALPRHLHVLAHHHRIGFVETPGQRILELARRMALVGLARP
jgi:hypothetical protein